MSRRYPVSEIYEERDRDYYPDRRGREYDEVDVVRRRTPSTRRPEREPEFLREDYGRTSAGPLVLRERKTEEFRREKPRERDYERDEVIIKPRREREQPREIEKEEFIFRPRERERPREVEKEEITFRSRSRPREVEKEKIRFRSRSRPREVEKEEITFRRGERERPPPPREVEKEEIVTFRRGERERPPPPREVEKEEIVTFRRPQREPPKEKDFEREEIIIRRGEEKKEEKKEEIVVKEPEIIREPTIHQEIITHHRHIEHEPERAPAPRPPPKSPSPSPPPRTYDEIEIRRQGTRNGQWYDDDIIIERENNRKRSEEEAPRRRRSMSGPRLPDYEDEAAYYNDKVQERAFIGEAYNGATKDWAIVDVPPGTNRVQMDGIGGASQEITWQRYNGVRRAKFLPDGAEPVRGDEIIEKEKIIEREPAPLPIGPPPPPPRASGLWTEITKDLVVKEAIEQVGYDYEETEFFFYIMDYLRYEDVLELVEISEDIRRERRERIREIQWERERINERRDWRPYEVEREVIYEGRRPGRYR